MNITGKIKKNITETEKVGKTITEKEFKETITLLNKQEDKTQKAWHDLFEDISKNGFK